MQRRMTVRAPDPDPATTPAIDSGVQPGDTPPDSSQTSATANRDPDASGTRYTPTAIISLIAIALLALLFLSTVLILFT